MIRNGKFRELVYKQLSFVLSNAITIGTLTLRYRVPVKRSNIEKHLGFHSSIFQYFTKRGLKTLNINSFLDLQEFEFLFNSIDK